MGRRTSLCVKGGFLTLPRACLGLDRIKKSGD